MGGMSTNAEIVDILEQFDPARQQELLDYHEQLIEEQRAEREAAGTP
jgi:hypothetical protein